MSDGSILMAATQAWTPKEATDGIRRIARRSGLCTTFTMHALDQMAERALITGDVLYVLKNGFVHDVPQGVTRGYYRYVIRCQAPNSGSRQVGVVVIPDEKCTFLKIVTVMWIDETSTRSGSIIGDLK